MSTQPLPDEELIASAQTGNTAALGELYDRYVSNVYGFISQRVDSREDAEDLTSEVMISMVRHLTSFSGKSSVKTWLFAIAKNTVASFWRARYQQPELLLAAAGDVVAGTTEEDTRPADAEDDLRRHKAEQVFTKLPDHYRQVLELRFFEQKTLAETAEQMKITVDNVKVMQHRALKKAAALAQEGI